MVRAGMFEDLDAMIQVHISSGMATSYGESGSGLVSTMYTFHGQSAHGAGAPWAGRSALDAVELMDVGWNFRREHLRLQQRSHSVIYNGGNQPNVVPSEATVWYYFRELDYPHIKRMHEIGTQIAEAAALMTDTEMTERLVAAAWQRHYNKTLAETVYSNIQAVGMPDWSEDDQAFARAVQEMMGGEVQGLRTEVSDPPSPPSGQNMGGGSDDIAEVSWNLPTIGLRYPGNIPGTTGHHWSAAIAEATPIAHKGCTTGAKVVATTVIDLLTDPSILEAAWDYFNEQTAEVKWESLIPDGVDPMVDIYENKMNLYRPVLEKLRYDPTRFSTYLEQLGVAYPTLKKPEGS
jgi:aminobenzoyl-glutamate utilization protein B